MHSRCFTPSYLRRLLASCALTIAAGAAHAQLQLITDEEARLPDAPPMTTRGITRAPGISLASPAEVPAQGFPLEIRVEPRGGSRIDPASLKVEYLKNPAVDVTERLKSHLREGAIVANAVRVPPGLHRFRVSVKDTEGRGASTVVEIRARP